MTKATKTFGPWRALVQGARRLFIIPELYIHHPLNSSAGRIALLDRLYKGFRENRGFLIFLLLMFVFRSAVADWNSVPTGSMKPSIIEGDRIWVNKLAYDLRLPFTDIQLLHFDDPERGDVVVFDSTKADKRLVKRVVGMPGETVQLRDNQVFIDGEAVPLSPPSEWETDVEQGVFLLKESLDAKPHWLQFEIAVRAHQRNFGPIDIPPGYYFVLGDNRDNSGDSRVIDLVPRGEIVGRTRTIVISLNYDNYYLPRSDRFLKSIDPKS